MLSQKKNSLVLLCLLLACCQKVDLTTEPENNTTTVASEQSGTVIGTGEGTMERPYTVTDILSLSLSDNNAVWVIGYMVGTARISMSNAVFSIDAENQSNILLAPYSTCTDTERCLPIELSSSKWKKSLSLPTNVEHFRKCLLVKGIPSQYMHRKGLRNISAGLWLDSFDLSSVAPQEWEDVVITSSQK